MCFNTKVSNNNFYYFLIFAGKDLKNVVIDSIVIDNATIDNTDTFGDFSKTTNLSNTGVEGAK